MINFKDFFKDIRGAGYITSPSDEIVVQGWLLVTASPAQKVPALLALGPAGAGKTFFAECLSEALGLKLLFYQCHHGTGKEELLYDLDVRGVIERLAGGVGSPSEYIKPGILPQAIMSAQEGPTLLVLDEIDKTRPELDAFLLDFLQSGRIVDPHLGIYELGGGKLYVFATSNEERLLSEPLMRRFRRVYMKYPPEPVEVEIISRATRGPLELIKGVVSVARWLRSQEVIKPPATPELVNLVRDVLALRGIPDKVMASQLAADVVVSWLAAYEEDKWILLSKYPIQWWVGYLRRFLG